MTKEWMAECLEEAWQLWDSLLGSRGAFDGDDKTSIDTIAAALYQERMRKFPWDHLSSAAPIVLDTVASGYSLLGETGTYIAPSSR